MNNKIPCGGFYLSDTLGVDESGKLGVNGGEPYKSLVTDGNGGVKWEDRLAYEVPEQWKLFTLDDASELAAYCTKEAYDAGKTFRVVIDGQVFDDVPVVEYYSAGRVYGIGEPINDSNPVWSDDGYGFLIRATLTVAYNPDKFSSKPKVFTDTFVYELVSPSNIKQIDPKYIEDMYYTQTIPGSDGPIITFQAYLNTVSPLTLSEPLIVDAPYTVKVENDKYETTCTTDGDRLFITVHEQGSLPTQGVLIVTDPINNPLVASWNGPITNKEIEIVRESQEKVKQINSKYVPKEVYFVKVDGSSFDKTFDEITEAYNAGMLVVVDCSGAILPLIDINTESLTFGLSIGSGFGELTLKADNTISNNYMGYLVTDNNGTLNNSLILPSSTSGSSKKFKITVDDTGAISATEVT